MTGDDDVDVHPEHEVAGGDPVGQRPSPHDRRAVDEQDVTGEDGPGVRHVHEQVALGVGRPDLDQLDLAAGHVEGQTALERPRRRGRFDALEVEVAEEAAEQVTDLAGRARQPGEQGRRHLGHLLGRGLGGDDLGPGDELVAVAVVTVGVGVDDGFDRRARRPLGERLEHLRRQHEVEQRVDEQ